MKNDAEAWRVNLEEGFDEAVKRFNISEPAHHIRVACDTANATWRMRHQIIDRLPASLGLTILTIGLCLIALPFTPRLAPVAGLAGIILGVSVLLSLGCFALYAWLISSAVGRVA